MLTTRVDNDKRNGQHWMRLEVTGDAYRAIREHHRQIRRYQSSGWTITRRGIADDGTHYMEAYR